MKIEASVGILFNQHSDLLMAERPKPKTWNGWWEFPGGKIELGESPEQALKRELKEEIGISVVDFKKWIIKKYKYEDYDVVLHFYKITSWSGNLEAKEKQKLTWVRLKKIDVSPILPANEFIFKAIALPEIYAITNAYECSGDFLVKLTNKLNDGIKLIQIREKAMHRKGFLDIAKKIIDITKKFDAKVLINSDIELAYKLNADGVHLNSIMLNNLSDLPKDLIIGGSCHKDSDIEKAIELDLDFITLSPIKKTKSHPKAQLLGWDSFGKIIEKYNMPTYALGGMTKADVGNALNYGGVGIASQRAIWNS